MRETRDNAFPRRGAVCTTPTYSVVRSPGFFNFPVVRLAKLVTTLFFQFATCYRVSTLTDGALP